MRFDELTTLRELEGRIISFIDQPEVIEKILQHLGLWEEAHAPPGGDFPTKEITFDTSYGSVNSPSRGKSRDSQVVEKPPYLPVRTRRQAATRANAHRCLNTPDRPKLT
jgi:hypothetical protein